MNARMALPGISNVSRFDKQPTTPSPQPYQPPLLPPCKPPLLHPPPLKSLQPLAPLPRQLPSHGRLGHAPEPQQLVVDVLHRLVHRPPGLGAAKRKHARQPDGAERVEPVGVLHDGQLRVRGHERGDARRVRHLGRVADAEADGLDALGEGGRGAVGGEEGGNQGGGGSVGGEVSGGRLVSGGGRGGTRRYWGGIVGG